MSPHALLTPGSLGQVNYFDYVAEGGVVSWSLVAMSVAVLSWVLILLFTCRRQTLCPPTLHRALVELLGDGDAAAARRALRDDPSILARMVEAGLEAEQDGLSPDRVQGAQAEAGAEQYARWNWRLGYLAVAANIAPMLGLLGTVVGIIEAFASFGASDKLAQQEYLSGAISKALITTFEGLLIAIPTLGVYALFRHRLGLIMLEAASRTEALVGLWRDSRTARSTPPDQTPGAATPPVRAGQL